MGWKILVPPDMRPEGKEYLLGQGHELISGNGTDTLNLIKDIKNADAAITRSAVFSREVLNAAKGLKAIACLGTGYDSVDLKTADEYGITVVNCPEANVISMVESTIFYMLYCCRQYIKVRRDFIDNYQKARECEEKQELWDKTLGIVGCGRVGSRVAEICHGSFHMKVLAYDPYKPAKEFPDWIGVVRNLDELLSESDLVSLHMFPRKEKKYRFGMEQFRKMKSSAYLINTVSSRMIDEEALYLACRDHVIAGAALDSLEKMPVDKRNPILYMDNVLISPRIGPATREAEIRTSLQAAMGIQEVYMGKKPSYGAMESNWEHMPVFHDTRCLERSGK